MATSSSTETPFVAFARPAIGPEEIAGVVEALESGWLTTGPRVATFEREFAAYVGAEHALGLNSCTAALHLSLLAAGVGQGDEVVTSPLTFCATANAIIHAGATPVFADVDPITRNLDPDAVSRAITPRTRAIIPVHLGGHPADMRRFQELARTHSLVLIEDAAHAIEAVSNAGRVGTTADFTCFSFYSTKNLTTGEGGMVVAKSSEHLSWMRTAALHGLSRDGWNRYARGGSPHYDVLLAGFKYNMMDVQAAIGLAQLARLEERHTRRAEIVMAYDGAFAHMPLELPAHAAAGERHAHHLYAILVDPTFAGRERDAVQEALAERGIGTSIHFRALHLHRFYAERLGVGAGDFPNAERISDTTLSLPLSASLTDDEVARVIDAVHAVFGGRR
jgi:dTDP-4-amino-4,6-dideoxygalactose transaminase